MSNVVHSPDSLRRARLVIATVGIGAILALVAGLVFAGKWLWQRGQGKKHGGHAAQQDALTYRNTRPEVSYVGDEACAACHDAIAESYRKHPMGRSFAPILDVAPLQQYMKESANPFTALGFEFFVERRSGQILHKQSAYDSLGKMVAETVAPVNYAVGSGTHAYSYLIQREGHLFQSPVTWYAQKRAWDLSPGFAERRDLFERPILPGCLFCHCNHANPLPDTLNCYRQPIFTGQAIGCERCHGPGELHVREREAGMAAEEPDTTIINPKRLGPALRDAVCQQCHLGGYTRVLRRGRQPFDFRPGLPLEMFWRTFVQPPGATSGNQVAGHVEQIHASACFRKSAGNLACISCHDPHLLPAEKQKVGYYRERCLQCHQPAGCTALTAARQQTLPADNCLACHMPRGATNVDHVALTDHRILRRPEDARPGASGHAARSPLLPFGQEELDLGDGEVARDFAVALMELARLRPDVSRLEASGTALPLLEEAVRNHPDDIAACESLGLALGLQNYRSQALTTCQAILERAPRREVVLADAALIAQSLGLPDQALGYWRRAVEVDPWLSRYRFEVARLRARRGEWEEAARQCNTVLALNGAHVGSRLLLVDYYQQAGRRNLAAAELETALALHPANAEELRQRYRQLLP
jgi:hypothetical protein